MPEHYVIFDKQKGRSIRLKDLDQDTKLKGLAVFKYPIQAQRMIENKFNGSENFLIKKIRRE